MSRTASGGDILRCRDDLRASRELIFTMSDDAGGDFLSCSDLSTGEDFHSGADEVQ